MHWSRRRNIMSKMDGRVFMAAIVFVCCALFSAFINADIKSVEGLEFSRVLLIGSGEVEISMGDTTSLKILGSEKALAPPPFFVTGNTLQLGITEQGHEPKRLKFKLTVTQLEALEVKGSGEAYVKPLIVGDLLVAVDGSGEIKMYDVSAENLEMRVIGSGTVQAVNVTADSARLNMKGSGDIQLGSLHAGSVKSTVQGSGDIALQDGGEADALHVTVMGSGDVSLGKLQANEANVSIMGSGDVRLRVAETLDVEILGSGDLLYYGKPTLTSSVLGSGDISRRD